MTPTGVLRTALAAAAIAIAVPQARARAGDGPTLAPPGGLVRAGETVELSWPPVPAGVEEMEILLSLDDGQSYPVRVSPELDARERRYRWRVPNLPAQRARLRLRLGTERAEIETEPTPAFRILGSEGASEDRAPVVEGTAWLAPREWRGPRAVSLTPAGAGLEAGADDAAPASVPRDRAAIPVAPAIGWAPAAPVAASPACRTDPSIRPRLVPLRI